MSSVRRILHAAVAEDGSAGEAGSDELREACRTDRQRIGVLLQGAALLAHLDHARWHLARGWGSARVGTDGRLVVGGVRPGRTLELPQDLLVDLLGRLFGLGPRVRRGIAGRGEARRAARALARRWSQPLAAISPDRAVAQVLEEAPFLWRDDLAPARRALAAGLVAENGEVRLWVAGPGAFRRRALAGAAKLAELQDRIGGEEAIRLWRGAVLEDGADPEALAAEGRRREALAAWEASPPGDDESRLARARVRFESGRFERALEDLGEIDAAGTGAEILRAACQLYLGRLGAATRTVSRALAAGPTAAETVELAEVGVRLAANRGDLDNVKEWARRALAAAREGEDALLARAELVAAQAAWDAGDREALRAHLEGAAPLVECPRHAPALAQVRALAALDGHLLDPAEQTEPAEPSRTTEAVALLTEAIGAHRRRLPRFTAAGLWNDLGVARAAAGDLAGAERAFLHALRLYRGCDGPRPTTLGLANLAEVRLRRGRLLGVAEILERSTAENRAAGNVRGALSDLLLWARHELLLGRAEAAVDLAERAARRARRLGLEGQLAEARVLAARALGWLGREAEAAEELDAAGAGALAHLEEEERPAVLALAGRRDEALAVASRNGAGAPWRAVLAGRPVPREAWAELGGLGDLRAARAVYDLELAAPGSASGEALRRAVGAFRRAGASRPAAELEVHERGAWRALGDYLALPEPGPAELGRLFAAAGYPGARLWWETDDDARVLVAGEGDPEARVEELAAAAAGGRLVLRAARVDEPLRVLFRLALARADALVQAGAPRPAAAGPTELREGPPADAGSGLVGESPLLRAAVERAGRLARGDLPVLVRGESGTGKELLARHLHASSRRRDAPLVTVNCAALSESLILSDLFGHVRGAFTGADRDRAGVFETADGGTVFLDEIGDLPASAQGLLLRTLQEGEVRRVGESLPRKVDVRVLAATHRDLAAAVRDGSFRADLYYRLKGAAIELPPLRERGRDVLALAEHLLSSERVAAAAGTDPAAPPGLSEGAAARLLAHRWPGNVRELVNVLSVGAALAAADGGAILPDHLDLPEPDGEPSAPPPAGGYHEQVEAFRRRLVADALAASDGVQAAAARRLGLSRQALSYLVKTLKVAPPAAE